MIALIETIKVIASAMALFAVAVLSFSAIVVVTVAIMKVM